MIAVVATDIVTIDVREWQSVPVQCTADIAAQMHADGHVTVAPLEGGLYEVCAKHKVGVLRYGPLELRITPKVAVSRLLHLATYADAPDAWRQLDTLLDETADPLSAIAHALAFFAERALRPAPLQGYFTHEEAVRQIRGRILFDRQISSRAGVLIPVELRYDDYELGIIENRVLKAGLGVAQLAIAERQPELARQLAHLRFRLDGVEPWPLGLAVPEITFSRLNERYRPGIALARLVLEQRSLEFPDRKHRGTSFLFDMNRVFESYLEAVLRAELERLSGQVRGQERFYLDEASSILMKPDITWWESGRCRAVVDAKYKRTTSQDYPNADAYQMLAYCTRLGIRRGWLVYADLGEQPGHTSVVRGSRTEIVVRALDVGGSLEQLAAQSIELARDIAAA